MRLNNSSGSLVIPDNILTRITNWLQQDARYYQILFQSFFLLFGLIFLDWQSDLFKFIITFSACLLTQAFFIGISGAPLNSLLSSMISALSLCLMLKTNLISTVILAAVLSIAGKFLIRINNKHVFNPTNFGIILTILLTNDAWISPGQWGSDAINLFLIGILGLFILLEVKRLDTALAFLFAFSTYHLIRSVIYLGWGTDVLMHQFSSGTLLLFTFFMITDPVSTPSHPKARIIWASIVGITAAVLQTKYWINGSPLWALFIFSPFTPLFDKLFRAEDFSWKRRPAKFKVAPVSLSGYSYLRITLPLLFIFSIISMNSSAFCGFYVARADVSLFNKASQVILVRDGEQSTVTMSSDFSGDISDFAMVVPVPVVLQKQDIRIVERKIFDAFDAYSGPRLVEYYDSNPCMMYDVVQSEALNFKSARSEDAKEEKSMMKSKSSVRIEAKYSVGEYNILILSSKESGDLEEWLNSNGYKIPPGAKDVLEPYIKSGMKFFVVKVNLEEFTRQNVNILRPLQITFNSPKFMLPIRLGMANSKGSQDMIVYALSKTGRIECSNYRTIQIPTDKNVPVFIKDLFGRFYSDMYAQTLKREGSGNIFLEYGWDISGSNFVKCDPCASTPPLLTDLRNAGANWLNASRNGSYDGSVYFTRLHVTYDREHFPQDLVFQETPNKQNFQGRYIITHPAPGPFDCSEGKAYLNKLYDRRHRELQELGRLTGWNTDIYKDYPNIQGYYNVPEPVQRKIIPPQIKIEPETTGINIPGPAKKIVRDTMANMIPSKNQSRDNLLLPDEQQYATMVPESGTEKQAGIPAIKVLRYLTLSLLSIVMIMVLLNRKK